jgi:hypothetical protein
MKNYDRNDGKDAEQKPNQFLLTMKSFEDFFSDWKKSIF